MSTKSRWSLFGGAYSGATIRARAAQEKLVAAQLEAGEAKAREWSIRMQLYEGPAQPSPTLGECENSGYIWLQVECRRCRHEAQVYLPDVRRNADTPIWRLSAGQESEFGYNPTMLELDREKAIERVVSFAADQLHKDLKTASQTAHEAREKISVDSATCTC